MEQAIQQMINLGVKDPLEGARKCVDLYGVRWVAEELAANWEPFIAEAFRQALGNQRRAAIVSIGDRARRGGKVAKREAVLCSMFIPSKGYIALGDATAEDLAEAAAYRRKMADGLHRWADFYESVQALVVDQGVARVRDVRGSLPELPSGGRGELSA